MKYSRNSQFLSKVSFYLIVLISFVGAFLIAGDKREVILVYVSIALIAILLFLTRSAKKKGFLQKKWQYGFARFFSVYLPFCVFSLFLPSFQAASLGAKLIISVIFSGMALAGIYFQEILRHNRGD